MNTITNKLYWKIAGLFIAMLFLLGITYTFYSTYIAQQYFQETNQRLNKEVAQFTTDHVTTYTKEGTIDTLAIQKIMHAMMIVNPSIEVYLLDLEGKILNHVAPYKKVKLDRVNVNPIKDFLATKGESYVLGDDPRDLGDQKVFSAAKILDGEEHKGYYYVILASELQESAASTIAGSYILRLGLFGAAAILLGALLLSLLLIWILTRNLRMIIDTVRRFKEGDLKARIANPNQNDLPLLSTTFNSMADKIVLNIDELKSVENLRRELIANVSHDLRTPLAIMRGYVETMQMKNENLNAADRMKYLDIIMDSNERLSKMVAQLFELSKLEAKQVQPNKEPFLIGELAQDVFHKYEILSAQKGIRMDLKLGEQLPLVFADISLVERVMQNLMDNALKFTPTGGMVTIAINKLAESVEVKVSDTGPGIPKNEQSFIFERYEKQTNHTNKQGTGLGLAIVKKILEIHDSTVEVQSEPNQGATFFFSLPTYQMG